MNTARFSILAACAAALAACTVRRAVEVNPKKDANANANWHAIVASPSDLAGAVAIQGSSLMGPGEKNGTTDVSLELWNAVPGGIHPWAVHSGTCGNDQGLFGTPDVYKPIEIKGNGRGKANATLSVQPPPVGGQYYVVSYASPTNTTTVIACGNFAPPTP
jgi:hypothetical protein